MPPELASARAQSASQIPLRPPAQCSTRVPSVAAMNSGVLRKDNYLPITQPCYWAPFLPHGRKENLTYFWENSIFFRLNINQLVTPSSLFGSLQHVPSFWDPRRLDPGVRRGFWAMITGVSSSWTVLRCLCPGHHATHTASSSPCGVLAFGPVPNAESDTHTCEIGLRSSCWARLPSVHIFPRKVLRRADSFLRSCSLSAPHSWYWSKLPCAPGFLSLSGVLLFFPLYPISLFWPGSNSLAHAQILLSSSYQTLKAFV